MSSFKYFSKGKEIKDEVNLSNSDEELLYNLALRLNALWEMEINKNDI